VLESQLFPVRFGSFTCSQTNHVGSMFDEDRNTTDHSPSSSSSPPQPISRDIELDDEGRLLPYRLPEGANPRYRWVVASKSKEVWSVADMAEVSRESEWQLDEQARIDQSMLDRWRLTRSLVRNLAQKNILLVRATVSQCSLPHTAPSPPLGPLRRNPHPPKALSREFERAVRASTMRRRPAKTQLLIAPVSERRV